MMSRTANMFYFYRMYSSKCSLCGCTALSQWPRYLPRVQFSSFDVGARRLQSQGVVTQLDAKHWLNLERSCTLAGLKTPRKGLFSFIIVRSFAKMKKAKAKKQAAKVDLSMDLAKGIVDLDKLQKNMDSVCARLKDVMAKKITTRISLGMFDDIMVETESGKSKLLHIAAIKSDQRFFIINILDNFPGASKKIEAAIKNAGYEMNFQTTGDTIRIQIPLVTKEFREQLKKIAKTHSDQSKVQIRKVRQQGVVELRKNQDLVSKDEMRLLENQIQSLHDNAVAKIDELFTTKTKELDK